MSLPASTSTVPVAGPASLNPGATGGPGAVRGAGPGGRHDLGVNTTDPTVYARLRELMTAGAVA